MKFSRSFLTALTLMVVVAAAYRLIPGRMWGFAPQWALGLFGAALFRNDKKWAVVLPLFSMLLSDLGLEMLYKAGYAEYGGFYEGQLLNYAMIFAVSTIGFAIDKPTNVLRIGAAAIASPLLYFVLSNTAVWAGHGGYQRPMTFNGYLMALEDGLPFLQGSLLSTVLFSAVLFGGFAFLAGRRMQPVMVGRKA